MRLIKTLWLAAAIAFSQTAFAELISEVHGTNMIKVQIKNAITNDDLKTLERIQAGVGKLKEITKEAVLVSFDLNSDGGDIYAAMAMGRIIRSLDGLVAVRSKSRCASACVFLLAGSGRRAVESGARVGIHRPYKVEAVDTTPALEKIKYERIATDVKKFLSDMNINQKLFDDMMLIPPHEIKILKQSELNGYGLDQDDPFIQESDAMARAKRLGITRAQLASREASEFSICGGWPDVSNEQAILRRFACRDRVLSTGK